MEDTESDDEVAEGTTPLSSCRGTFMDLLELELWLVLLLEPLNEPIEDLLLWASGVTTSDGFCMTFVLLQSEPEHFIFLHFLLLSSTTATCSCCCFCFWFCCFCCFCCLLSGSSGCCSGVWRCLKLKKLLTTVHEDDFSGFWRSLLSVLCVSWGFLEILGLAIGAEINAAL